MAKSKLRKSVARYEASVGPRARTRGMVFLFWLSDANAGEPLAFRT
jgi:hypothetical protein